MTENRRRHDDTVVKDSPEHHGSGCTVEEGFASSVADDISTDIKETIESQGEGDNVDPSCTAEEGRASSTEEDEVDDNDDGAKLSPRAEAHRGRDFTEEQDAERAFRAPKRQLFEIWRLRDLVPSLQRHNSELMSCIEHRNAHISYLQHHNAQ
jgi:hypothetical protein